MNFYVYVHRRLDTGLPFYVGKGKGARLRVTQHRNPYWERVVAKAGGFDASVAADGLDEELAHLAEMELIAKFRAMGIRLTNLTDGGEGMAGFKAPADVIERRAKAQRGQKRPTVSAALKGRPKSKEHRERLADAHRGLKASEEARGRMSASRKGRPSSMLGKKHSEEAKRKISEAVSGDRAPFLGRKHTDESKRRMSASHSGVKLSEETRQKMSVARSGELHYHFGKPVSEARKAKQAAALKARPLLTCPHCGIASNDGNARRWHFDKCKGRKP